MKKELLTPEDIRLLSHNPLLRGFSENDCKKLLTALRASVRSYPKNTEILSAGSPATQIGIVLEGSAQVISSDVFGNQTIFGMIEPPDLFAEAFCCAGSPAIPVSVLAVHPTRVLFLTYPGAPTPNQSPADAYETDGKYGACPGLQKSPAERKAPLPVPALHTRKTAGLSVLPGQSCQQPYFFHSL